MKQNTMHKKPQRVYPLNFQKIIKESKKIAKKFIFKVQEKVSGNDIILVVIATWRKKFLVYPVFSSIDPDHKKNANAYILKHKNKKYKYREFKKICEIIEEIIE
jgi:hypothetical protein